MLHCVVLCYTVLCCDVKYIYEIIHIFELRLLCCVTLCYVMLCCVVLCCVALSCIVLCCVALSCVVLCCVVLSYIVLCCVVLCSVVLYCINAYFKLVVFWKSLIFPLASLVLKWEVNTMKYQQ